MMSRTSPYIITLSRHGRKILESRARKYTLPCFEVLRAKMILLAADGWASDEIAAALSVGREIVSLWRKCFFWATLARPRGAPPVRPSPGFPPGGRRAGQGPHL